MELKIACAKAQLAIKDFVHVMILKGVQELQNEELKKRLKESVQQSKENKARVISITELDDLLND